MGCLQEKVGQGSENVGSKRTFSYRTFIVSIEAQHFNKAIVTDVHTDEFKELRPSSGVMNDSTVVVALRRNTNSQNVTARLLFYLLRCVT